MSALDKLANEAWEAVMTAHAVLLKEFEAADTWANLSMREYDVLYTLSKCGGPIRMGELGRSVLLSQPGLSRLVDRLVQRGYVLRTSDPVDGRSVRVSLTEAGAARQREVGRLHARGVSQAMTSALNADELRHLRALAGKLVARPEVRQSTTAPAHWIADRTPTTHEEAS